MSTPETNQPLDTSVRLPAALRARVAQADSALDRMRQGKPPTEQQAQEPAQPPQDGDGQQEPIEPQGGRQEPPPRDPERPQEARPQEPRQNEPRQSDKPADWEHRYNSLHGQIEPLRESNRALREENDTLRESLGAMEDRLRSLEGGKPPEQQGTKEFDINSVLSEEEREDWGDLTQVIDKVTKAAQAPLLAKIQELEKGQQRRQQVEQTRTKNQMHDYLDKEVPDWETINTDPAFYKDWATKTDELSGQSYKKLLQTAYDRNEASRVASIFKRFLSETGRAQPESRQGQERGRAAAPKSLDQFAAPGKGRSAATQSRSGDDEAAPTFKLSEYTAFHKDKALGRLRMTADEIRQRGEELDRAYAEGRLDLNA